MQSFLWINFNDQKRQELTENAKSQVSQFDLFYNNCSEDPSIEVIRSLQEFLSRQPLQSEFNLALLTEAHNLTTEAQNALLKTLEEPPTKSKIILIAPHLSSLLPTIVSRCQIVEHSVVKEDAETDWDLIEKVVKGSESVRIDKSEDLDLKSWIYSWQQLLQSKINGEERAINKLLSTEQINGYLKKLLKLYQMKENHVNSKLLNLVTLLSAPKIQS